jgi:hypothetical protein
VAGSYEHDNEPWGSIQGREFLDLLKKDSALYNHEGVSESFRTGYLELELQMVRPCTTRCSFIAIL